MPDRHYKLHDGKTGAAITVRISPRALRNEITEILSDGTVKIRLIALPAEEQANEALIRFLAEVFDISPNKIQIVAGLSGHDKLVTLEGISADAAQKKIIARMA